VDQGIARFSEGIDQAPRNPLGEAVDALWAVVVFLLQKDVLCSELATTIALTAAEADHVLVGSGKLPTRYGSVALQLARCLLVQNRCLVRRALPDGGVGWDEASVIATPWRTCSR